MGRKRLQRSERIALLDLIESRTHTHEGAAAFDLSAEDPLTHLVFTKGAALFEKTFYRTQAEEILRYADALLEAEKKESGFGWKFAAYMRDPKKGKGNRIQGTIAPAILCAANPESRYVSEYVEKCLSFRADDVAIFATHFTNLGLGEIGERAREGMGRALSKFDEYQILKYASRQFPLEKLRAKGGEASLRLVDAMGIAKRYLSPESLALYRYLHAKTAQKDALSKELPLARARRAFFRKGEAQDFAAGRLSVEQALSQFGSTSKAWRWILDVEGLLPDIAFKQYVRAMGRADLPIYALVAAARKRRFVGLWPHQIYAGYRTVMDGKQRLTPKGEVCFARAAMPELGPVFEMILLQVADALLPKTPSLGIADISGSMFGAKLGGDKSSSTVGDAAIVLAALMSNALGYAATFSDEIHIEDRPPNMPLLEFADIVRKGPGWGSTQVAGSVVSLIQQLSRNPGRARPRTLYFFSDMQFHPPDQQTIRGRLPEEIARLFKPNVPPLLAAIHAYRTLLGPVDVVLWNLAAYDNAPLPSNMEGVMMLAGFDANSFAHVATWQAAGSPATLLPPSSTKSAARPATAELDYIRGF